MKLQGKFAKKFSRLLSNFMPYLSVHVSSSGYVYFLVEHAGDSRCIKYRTSSMVVISIVYALLENSKPALLEHLKAAILNNLRVTTDIDLNEIHRASQLLHLAIGGVCPQELQVDTLFISDCVQKSLINRCRMELFSCGDSAWNWMGKELNGLRTALGMDVYWPKFCNDHGNGEVDFSALPQWMREIIAQYEEPKKKYKITGCVLSDTQAVVDGVTGSGIVLGELSYVTDCYLAGALVYNSKVNGCDLVTCYINSSWLEKTTVNNSYIDASELKTSEVIRSTVRFSVIETTSVTEGVIVDSRAKGSQVECCFCCWHSHTLIMQNWTIDNICIDSRDSYEKIMLSFKKSRLSKKVHDYYCKDANLLQTRAAAGEFIYGIELEVLTQGNTPITYKPSYCRIKPDSSLPLNGLEIVTRPDSMDVHVRNLRRMLRINKLAVNESCGMHVHVPPKAAKAKAIKKRIYEHKEKYYRIAGRVENKYCAYDRDNQRYQAVNDSYETIEFRLFSGTVSIHKIKRRLQWVRAMCEWSKKIADKPEVTFTYTPEMQRQWNFSTLGYTMPLDLIPMPISWLSDNTTTHSNLP